MVEQPNGPNGPHEPTSRTPLLSEPTPLFVQNTRETNEEEGEFCNNQEQNTSLQPIRSDDVSVVAATAPRRSCLPCWSYGRDSRPRGERRVDDDEEEEEPEPVYTVPNSPPPGAPASPVPVQPIDPERRGLNDWILDMMERWISSLLRRDYSPRAAYIIGGTFSATLIIAILVLFLIGRFDVIMKLSRDLVCELIHTLGINTEPNFCKIG
ncbi:uncharacterized protein LODBEIA_P21740 [Lodderomyces beijingensis]|uniref:Uncharacterized protein n=1 Tax=Lodderomyces beijingensis TaxID=1775926 RepID=A0ABP0ZP04_9ASCO